MLQEQASHIAHIVFLGAVLGMVIDMYRVVSAMLNPGKYLAAVYDIVFWLACTLWTFLYLLRSNSGEARLYVLALLLVGFILQQSIVGNRLRSSFKSVLRAVVRGVSKVIGFIAVVVDGFLNILVAPVRFVARLVIRPFAWLVSLLMRPARYGKRRLGALKRKLHQWWRPPEEPKDF